MKRFMIMSFKDETISVEAQDNKKQPTMEDWFSWKERMGSNLLDLGTPLFDGTVLDSVDQQSESSSGLSGYMMIQAEDKKEALKLVADSPLFDYKGQVRFELFECMEMN